MVTHECLPDQHPQSQVDLIQLTTTQILEVDSYFLENAYNEKKNCYSVIVSDCTED